MLPIFSLTEVTCKHNTIMEESIRSYWIACKTTQSI